MNFSVRRRITFLIVLQSIFILAIIFTLGLTFQNQKWGQFYSSIFLIPFSFITLVINDLFEKRNIKIPSFTYIFFHMFLIATLYLGPMLGFYEKYAWWDSLLHFLSGPLLTLIGFNFLSVLRDRNIVDALKSSAFLMSIMFAFSLGTHTIWELYEFLIDLLFGTKMTNFDFMDTMLDSLLNFISSLISIFIIRSVSENNRVKI